jgi:hypothetical protein
MAPRQSSLALTEDPPDADDAVSVEGRETRSPTAEDHFAAQCRQFQLPAPERQFPFAKATHQRMWRFDFSWRQLMVAVEIEGVVPRKLPSGLLVMAGRHGSVKGVIEDMVKYNTAVELGWWVLRFPPKFVTAKRSKVAIETTIRVLAARGWKGAA